MRALLVIPLSAAILLAGCLDPSAIPGVEQENPLGGPDLADAELALTATSCMEGRVAFPVNGTRGERLLPGDAQLANVSGFGPEIGVTALDCRNATLDGEAIGAMRLVIVSARIQPRGDAPGPHDQLLWLATTDATLTSAFEDAGVAATTTEELTVSTQRQDALSEHLEVHVPEGPAALELSATSVTIRTETRFDSDATLGARFWAGNASSPVLVHRSMDIEELGGLSGDLGPKPGTQLEHLIDGLEATGAGHSARFDMALGVFKR